MSHSTSDIIRQFHDALEARGILVEGEPIADGDIHRTGTTDKPRKKDAAYCLHLDGVPAGWFQNHRDGQGVTRWRADIGRKYTDAENKAYRALVERQKAKRQQHDAERRVAARKRAAELWDAAEPVTDHPYLARKGIEAHGVKAKGGRLVIPARDTAGELHTLQFIAADGGKRFLIDGAVRGNYFEIGARLEGTPLCLCEGFATGASIHEATGYPVAVAFDCGNLEAVARALKATHPARTFIVCADNDSESPGNPGLSKGRAAALAIDAELCVPDGVVDFNDLHAERGLDAVREAVQAAEPQPPQDQLEQYMVRGAGVEYSVSERGVFMRADDGEKYVCSRLDVVAQARDIDSVSWGRLLRFKDSDGVLHEWCLPMHMLATDGADMRRALMDQGLRIGADNAARRGLSNYIQDATPERRARAVLRTGWEPGGAYVLPGEVVSPEGYAELVYLQTVNAAAARWYSAHGTLDEWRAHVATPARGNSRLVLGLCTAFAAPLLEATHSESGGIHLYGQSSQGKTTTLLVTVSVWGNPAERIQSWRATSNGIEGVAAAHNDSVLGLDEIGQCDEREVGQTAYMLANGKGKTRSNRDASLRQSHTWRLLFLSTGEQSMHEYLDKAGHKVNAGQTMRFVDLPAVPPGSRYGVFETVHDAEGDTPEQQGQRYADALVTSAKRCHGTAGRAFLATLLESDYAAELAKLRRDFKARYTPTGAASQVLRVLDRFSLIAAAGELATRYGVTGWEPGEAFERVGLCAADWIEARGGVTGMEDQQIVESLTAFIESEAARFEAWPKGQYDKTPQKRAGFYKVSEETWYIFPAVFRKEVCKGLDTTRAAKVLYERRYIAKRSRESFQVSCATPDGQRRLYVVRLPENDVEQEKPVSPVAPVSVSRDAGSGQTGQDSQPVSPVWDLSDESTEKTGQTGQTNAPVCTIASNGAAQTGQTGQTGCSAPRTFSDLPHDLQEVICHSVELVKWSGGDAQLTPESFLTVILDAGDKVSRQAISQATDRLIYGPGADG